jgi:hypothetical protein
MICTTYTNYKRNKHLSKSVFVGSLLGVQSINFGLETVLYLVS